MKKILVVLLLLSFNASAQNDTLVLKYPMSNEPSLAVNPWNNAMVLLAFNTSVLLKSNDTGKTFTPVEVKSRFGFYGDPVLSWIDSVHYGLAHLAKNKKYKWPKSFDRIVFQRGNFHSNYLDHSVGIGHVPGKMQDKPWFYCEPDKTGRGTARIHLTWTQFDKYDSRDKKDSTRIRYASSVDNGTKFTKAKTISRQSGSCMDGDSAMEGVTSVKGSDGKLYAAWSGLNKLWFTISNDNGQNWSTAYELGEHYNGWSLQIEGTYRANGMPFLSAWKNYVVIVWAASIDSQSLVCYQTYNTTTATWGSVHTIPSDWTNNFMPAITVAEKGILITYYSSKDKYPVKENKEGIYIFKLNYALLGEQQLTGSQEVKVIAIEGTEFASTRSPFIGDYIAVQVLNSCAMPQALVAYCKVYANRTTGISIARFKF